MSEQREVTVQNVVDVTAHISEEQVRRYLKRTGWRPVVHRQYTWCHDDELHPILVAAPLDRVVGRIAAFEKRQPGDVLNAIAKKEA